MLNITIICVGKIKEKYYSAAIDEYIKRISRFAKISVAEVKDEPIPLSPSDGEKTAVLLKEAERIKTKLPKSAHIIALCVEGRQCSSEDFAEKLSSLASGGISHIAFIIGGSLGLADNIKMLADEKLSFSKMTLPHQLMRVVLAEQIYRAMTINSNITYHK
mgnify:CR=1 FL=1